MRIGRVMGTARRAGLIDISRKSELWEVLNDRTRLLGHCSVCALRNNCGGCRARADAYFGRLDACDPGCIFNEEHWRRLVDAGIALDEDAEQAPEEMPLAPPDTANSAEPVPQGRQARGRRQGLSGDP